MINITKHFKKTVIAVASVLVVTVAGSAFADTYPKKPIKIIVPFGAGGGSDIVMRTIQPYLEKSLGESIVVINVPGSGSVAGSRRAKGAKADGYTVLLNHTTLLTAMVTKKADFSYKDFDIVANAVYMPLVVAVPKNSPINNLQDLAAFKKKHGKAAIAGVNLGAINHFAMGMIAPSDKESAVRYVQTGGGAKTMAALLGKHIDVGILAGPEAKPLIESGDIKLIASLSDQRIPYFPNTLTALEQGVEASIGIQYTWYMPKGVDQDTKDIFAKALSSAIGNDSLVKALTDRGSVSNYLPGKESLLRVEKLFGQLEIINNTISK
ncbi:MAG: tripartite tricarboxylate transporter substrate binding protein [Oceanospirillaceae bacterium]|nr:tripartite tricarboxylate transporter substrate binding protein [Oceanospirillaceae bacterium]